MPSRGILTGLKGGSMLGPVGAGPEKGSEDDQRTTAPLL